MSLNSNDIFSRLLKLYNTTKMNELSEMLGYKQNWGAATRTRNGIPFEACVVASVKYKVSLDYLIFGKENQKIEITELKLAIGEGVFSAIQHEIIKLDKQSRMSDVTDRIANEIIDNFNIDTSDKKNEAI